jgi:hypothetical protein
MLNEKKLTPAEIKKREEIAQAIERDNPDMPMDKKMAIATATAKRVAETQARSADFQRIKYTDPNSGKIRWRRQKQEFKVESVQESVSKAYEIMKPTKSMDHGIEAIKKHMKVDHATATKLAKQVMDKVKKGEFVEEVQEGSPTRLDMIRKAAEKYNKQKKAAERKAERDAKKAMSKDADLGENNGTDKPPFEGGYKVTGPKKDKFGNTIKVQNIAKKLARKAMDSAADKEKVKLKGFGPDAPKGNMGSSTARASLKPKAPKRTDESVRLIEREDTAHHVAKTLIQMGVRHDTPEHEVLKKIPAALKVHGLHNNKLIQRDPDFHGDVFDSLSSLHKKNESVHEAVHPDHVSLHPHKTDKKKYTVGQVGRNVKGRLKTGEHLNDTQVDDLHDMGMKVKHERGPLREADFDTNFKKRIALKVSGPKSVRDYMKTKVDQKKADHAKQDPSAVKQGYGPGVIPPGTAYRAATKRGMNPSQAANAVSNAFKNRGKPRKLPEETQIDEAVINTLQDIVKTRGAKEIKFKDGRKMKVDMQTANTLTKVHKSLNSTNAKKFADKLEKSQSDFMKLLDFAYTVTR